MQVTGGGIPGAVVQGVQVSTTASRKRRPRSTQSDDSNQAREAQRQLQEAQRQSQQQTNTQKTSTKSVEDSNRSRYQEG